MLVSGGVNIAFIQVIRTCDEATEKSAVGQQSNPHQL